MTRSRLARVLTILGLTALLVAGAACGDNAKHPALSGDDITTTTSSTTTTAAP